MFVFPHKGIILKEVLGFRTTKFKDTNPGPRSYPIELDMEKLPTSSSKWKASQWVSNERFRPPSSDDATFYSSYLALSRSSNGLCIANSVSVLRDLWDFILADCR
jgi:hypothetical protein